MDNFNKAHILISAEPCHWFKLFSMNFQTAFLAGAGDFVIDLDMVNLDVDD